MLNSVIFFYRLLLGDILTQVSKKNSPVEKSRDHIHISSIFILMVFDFLNDVGSTRFSSDSLDARTTKQDLIVFASNRYGTICTLANGRRNGATF